MASAKIGGSKTKGKKVSGISNVELIRIANSSNGKSSAKAKKELEKRGVDWTTHEIDA